MPRIAHLVVPALRPTVLAAAVALAAPAVAAAQASGCPAGGGTRISIHETDGRRTMLVADRERCLEVRSVGDVEFTEDDTDVRRLSPGGWLTVEETRGGVTRRIEFGERDGRVTRRFARDGRAVDEAEGATWLSALVPALARESLAGAPARAARVLRQRGAQGLLDEAALIASDRVKGVYVAALLDGGRPTAADLRASARFAARALSSDGEKGRVLRGVVEHRAADPSVVASVVEASRTIASDPEKGRVLAAALASPAAGPETRGQVASAARTIASDRTKAELLTAVAPGVEPTDALFDAVDGIASDRERGTVLRALLRRDALPRPALVSALRSAGRIASDREKADVLLAAAARRETLADDETRRTFLQVTRTIASSGEYRRVMDAVVR